MVDQEAENWKTERFAMVRQQIEARGITDSRVLEAMRSVPRHLFVPAECRREAYEDHPLLIGFGQTISQPYIIGYMTDILEPKAEDRVLEIGTGSGYQAAVLSMLVSEVYTVENIRELAEQARDRLHRLGYGNVHVKWGDGYFGWPEKAPFDAILATAAPPAVPEPFVQQLRLGGRMVLPVGEGLQELVLITKTRKGIVTKKQIPVRFVPMVHLPP